jgi:hypothetical protein
VTDIVIYHDPECDPSRNSLTPVGDAGIEPKTAS